MIVRVFIDANILFPVTLRDLFVELDRAGALIVLWSRDVQEEWVRNAIKQNRKPRLREPSRPEWNSEKLKRLNDLMNRALPHARVTGYEHLIESIEGLADPHDRHVVAAALIGKADVLVSDDRKAGFANALSPFGISHFVADEFLVHLIAQSEASALGVIKAIRRQLADYKRPPVSARQLLSRYRESGLSNFVRMLSPHIDKL